MDEELVEVLLHICDMKKEDECGGGETFGRRRYLQSREHERLFHAMPAAARDVNPARHLEDKLAPTAPAAAHLTVFTRLLSGNRLLLSVCCACVALAARIAFATPVHSPA